MESYTILFIPDHNAKVRRFQVSGRRMRRTLWGATIGSVLLALGSVDYVRARVDTFELDRLRSETAAQRAQLERLSGTVNELEARFERVSELERKVRVIADLPAPAERSVAPPGVGGGSEDEALPELPPQEADLPAAAPAAPAPEPQASLPASPHAARVARLREQAQRLNWLARSREASMAELVEGLRGKTHRLASTPSIWPTKGWVTSRYGYRTSPFTGLRQFHGGVDIAGRPGTDVVAPARGRVVFVGRKGPMGKTLTLDHGYGVRTTFGHNAEIFVKKGQEVMRGDRIAALGNSGRSTGPHLHYGVSLHGRRVNPMNYILDE